MQHYTFQVTCPAGVAQSAPVEVDTSFPPGTVERVRVHIPRGHASKTGIQAALAHQPILPPNAGVWILGDNDEHDFTPGNLPDSGAWSAFMYNTDTRAHYWQIIFDVADPVATVRRPAVRLHPFTPSELYAAAGR